MEWQPIETAPRDGTKFFATDFNRYSDARWPPGHIIGRLEPMMSGAEFRYGGGPLDFEPTHWMPLPEPPKTEG